MSDWLGLALAILATYRVAVLVALDDGPFDVFARWRERVGQVSWVGRGFHCPVCVGFWAALAAAIAVRGPRQDLILWWLAAAGGSAWLYRAVRHD